MFLPIICLGVFVLYVVFALFFVVVKSHGYKKAKKHEEEITKHAHMPMAIIEAVGLLSERKYGFILNYHLFQATNKAFGLLSVTYSIIGLMSLSLKVPEQCGMDKWLGCLICFVSIIFVILALYLTPTNRASQYLAAWRKCDDKMCEVLSQICCYASLLYEYNNAMNMNPKDPGKVKEAAKSITDTAKSITSIIPLAESMLSGEES